MNLHLKFLKHLLCIVINIIKEIRITSLYQGKKYRSIMNNCKCYYSICPIFFAMCGLLLTFIFNSCSSDSNDIKTIIRKDSTIADITVNSESATPLTAVVNYTKMPEGDDIIIYSSNKDHIYNLINHIESTGGNYGSFIYTCDDVFFTYLLNGEQTIMLDNLEPDTKYYYFRYYWEDYSDILELSKVKDFTTDKISLNVDMGGDCIWCGVNFLKDRGSFDNSQFFKLSAFRVHDLPDSHKETIEGNWRYPTKSELQELVKNSHVTYVDIQRNCLRLSYGESSMYVSFTQDSGDYHTAYLFPCEKGEYGIIANFSGKITDTYNPKSIFNCPIYGNEADHDTNLEITDKFYFRYNNEYGWYETERYCPVRFVKNK